jgi:RNA-directed DNA polymerase
MKDRVRHITGRLGGRSMAQVIEELQGYLPGWRAYFSLAETHETFVRLDKWIRRRLRAVHLKQWKRGPNVYRELRARGASDLVAARVAAHMRRWWATSAVLNNVLTISYFDALGVPTLAMPRA